MDNRYSESEIKEKPYIVYRNDLKNKLYNKIDSKNAIWYEKDLKDIHETVDTDSVSYRIEECKREKYYYIDLSHLNQEKVNEFFSSAFFEENKTKILHVFAEACDITTLPDLKQMTKLETLNVSHNNLVKLTNLPHSLIELEATNNKLIKVHSKLRNVERLNLSFNNLSELVNLRKCKTLNISNNKFDKFTSKCPFVYELNLSNNNLTSVDSSLIPNVETLNISHTNIEVIANLEKLHLLIGQNSKLKTIGNLGQIISLDIAGSCVKKIPYERTLRTVNIHDDPDLEIHTKYKVDNHIKNKYKIWCITFAPKTEDII
jgi:hypothetical protein